MLILAGGLILIRFLPGLSSLERTYVLHGWMLLTVDSWLIIFRHSFPLGSLAWSSLHGWLTPWLIVGGLYLVLTLMSPGPSLRYTIWVVFLFEGVFVGLTEEFFFRGLLQTTLHALIDPSSQTWGLSWGTVTAALIFGLSHLINLSMRSWGLTFRQVLFSTVMGLILGHYYDRTRNLWGAVILHNLIDSLSVMVLWVIRH